MKRLLLLLIRAACCCLFRRIASLEELHGEGHVGVPGGIPTKTTIFQTISIVVPNAAQTYTATYIETQVPSGPIAFVQVNSSTPQTDQSTVTTAFANAQTIGNLNVVVIGWDNTTSNIVSVTDTAVNSYQVAAPITRSSGNSQTIYYARNIVGGAITR